MCKIKVLIMLLGITLCASEGFGQAQMNPSHNARINIAVDKYFDLISVLDNFYQTVGSYKTVEPDLLSRVINRKTIFITYRLGADTRLPFSSVLDWIGAGKVDIRLYEDRIPEGIRITVICNIADISERFGGQLVDLRTGKVALGCGGKIS